MRLDAIASAGFRMSRSKMMDLIKAGGWGGRAGMLAGRARHHCAASASLPAR